MTNSKILICMTDLPFPARKNGISIRYQPIISHLSKSFLIDLVVISNHPVGREEIAEARKYCSSVNFYLRKKQKVPIAFKILARTLSLFPSSGPFVYFRYDEKEIEKFVQGVTKGKKYKAALCVSMDYVSTIKNNVFYDKLVIDFIDSPSASRSRLKNKTLFDRYDLIKLRQHERKEGQSADHTIYISPLDLQLGTGHHKPPNGFFIIPNGLYIEDKSDECIHYGKPTIGYLGHMGYPPNINAAKRLIKIHSSLRNDFPDLELVIIGRSPAEEILNHKNDPGVRITGTVDNVWPYINGIDIFVFPMEIGSGQQNKILESMGAGKAVVTTSLGNSGIGAKNGEQFVKADSDEEIRLAIFDLLENKEKATQISSSAKDFVYARYSWANIFEKIDLIFDPN